MGFSLSDLDPTKLVKDGVEWIEDTGRDFLHNPLDALGGLAEDSFKGILGVVTLGQSNKYDSSYFFPKPDLPIIAAESRKNTIRSTTTARHIVYGEVKKGGVVVFAESSGEDDKYLHLVVVLAAHSCKSIKEIYFGDTLVAVQGQNLADDTQSFVIEDSHDGKLDAFAQLGAHTASATDIQGMSPDSWTSHHKLLGQTYLYLRLEYDREIYRSGVPNVSVVMEGKDDIYDPRDASTGYTKNHALCVLDYMRFSSGMNLPDSVISMPSFEAAADVSDDQVATAFQFWAPIEITETRYEVSGVLSVSSQPLKNLEALLQSGGSWIARPQGIWTIVPTGYTAPVLDFDENDLVGGIQFDASAGKQSRLNTVRGTYVDPHQDWELTDYYPVSIDSYVANDLETLSTDSDHPLVTSGYQCQRLAKLQIERSRYGLTVSGVFKFKALELSVGDRITLSISSLGWVNRVFQVYSMDLSMAGGIAMVLREDAPEIYQWTAGDAVEIEAPPAVNLPDANTVSSPTNLTISPEGYITEVLSRLRSRLTASWTPGSAAAVHYEIQFSESNGDWRVLATNWQDTSFTVENIGEGIHRFRVRAVNSIGIKSDPWLEGQIEIDFNSSVNLDASAPLIDITNLGLHNNATTNFVGGDASFSWDHDNGGLSYFLHYKVEILDTGLTVLRTETTTDPFFDYTLEKNREDGAGRTFTIRVTPVSRNLTDLGGNHEGNDVVFTASNEAPSLPTGLAITSGFKIVTINFTPPTDPDYQEMRVWLGTSTGFVRDASSLIAASPGSPVTISGLDDNTQYYIRVAPYDVFGEGAVSSEFLTLTHEFNESLSPWAYVNQVDRDFILDHVDQAAIPSQMIEKVTASQIVAGTIAALESISVEGLIESIAATYRVSLGPKQIGNDIALFSFMNSTTPIVAFYEDGTAVYNGKINIANNSTGYAALNDTPNNLSDINSTEGSKLGGIEDGATNTTDTSQLTDGANLGSTANWSGINDDNGEMPEANATNGADWSGNLGNIPIRFSDNASPGLNLTATHMGFYDAVDGWKAWFDDDGGMYLSGDGTNFLTWDGAALTYQGKIQTASGNGERIEIRTDTNQFHAYWDRGDGTVEELVNIGNTGTSSGAITLGSANFDGPCIMGRTNGVGRICLGAWSNRGTGVYGVSESAESNTHAGVDGRNEGTAGGPGVYGSSNSGYGVYGRAVLSTGVFGEGEASGVKGVALFSTSYGVHGVGGDVGVFGTGNDYGVEGAGSLAGLYGTSAAGHGVLGITTASSGAKAGVYGSSTDQYGVRARSTNSQGVYATSDNHIAIICNGYVAGIKGESNTYASGKGVVGEANGASGRGVEGRGGAFDFYAGGSGANYGPFTGAHDALLSKAEASSGSYVEGDIVKVISIAARSTLSNVLAEIEIQDSADAKNSFGVFLGSAALPNENDIASMSNLTETEYLAFQASHDLAAVNGVGEGQINVVDEGGDIEIGDFICTSNTPGKGKAYSGSDMRLVVARAIEPVAWNDEASNEKKIACIYMCG